MAYLGNIMKHLETTFDIKIQGKFYIRTEIEGIRFVTAKEDKTTEYTNTLLYIGYSQEVPLTAYPQNLLLIGQNKSHTNSQILYIQEPLEITEVFNAVQEVVFKHYMLKLKREELFQSLHSDRGIAGIIHVAHTFLNNPVTICDSSFSVIASSPFVKDIKNLEEKNGRLYLKDLLFQDMADRNIIKHIYSSSTPYITKLDNYPYKWVFESIRIHHAVVGYICVRGTVREFTEDDLEFINVFSQMLSIEMQKDSSFRHPTGLKYEYFLTELLEGHCDRIEYITNHLIQLGHTKKPFYTIFLLKFTDLSYQPQHLKGYYEQLLSLLPNCMVVLYRGNITILQPSDTSVPFNENETVKKRFIAFLQFHHMQAFISYPYTDIAKSDIYYKQVEKLSLLFDKTAHKEDQECIYYETYFLEHCFYEYGDSRLLTASIHPSIAQIIQYDRTSNTEYARTLRVYLAQNRNALAAAKDLHIHKSTFFYRLGKMADLFGIDINDGLALFTYEYSFRVLDYLSRN